VTRVDSSDDRATGWAGAGALLRVLEVMPGRHDEAVAVVNGLFGDSLEGRDSDLATPMTLRTADTVLPLDRDALAGTLADVGTRVNGRICVLVHGLMSTESIWRFPDGTPTTYGTLLAEDHDVTVLSLRYNSGRHIATNGRDLARVLEQLVTAWPVRVREINLIGHSMGGLVIRSACHYGRSQRPRHRFALFGRRWTSSVRRVVLIGVPNNGAGLEALVNTVSGALTSFNVAAVRAVARGLDRRSAGIKDLRLGTILDDAGTPRAGRADPQGTLRRAAYLVIAGSVTADPDHRLATLLGDALVTSSSAAGRTDDLELFPGATIRTVPKVTHNALAHHPEVYQAITDWW
jgi:triacylglycerol lipase